MRSTLAGTRLCQKYGQRHFNTQFAPDETVAGPDRVPTAGSLTGGYIQRKNSNCQSKKWPWTLTRGGRLQEVGSLHNGVT